jgi:hypothetical protein
MNHQTRAIPQAPMDAAELRSTAGELEVINRSRALFNAKRLGMSVEEYERRVRRRWDLGLEDALKFHAVDGEADSVPAVLRSISPADGGTP